MSVSAFHRCDTQGDLLECGTNAKWCQLLGGKLKGLGRRMGKEKERAAVWAEYQLRRTLAWVVPLALTVAALLPEPWLISVAVSALVGLKMLWERWPCPRCGRPFEGVKRNSDWSYSKQCQNCSLGLWKNPGDVEAYREKRRRSDALLAAHAAELRRGRRLWWRHFFRRKPKRKSTLRR